MMPFAAHKYMACLLLCHEAYYFLKFKINLINFQKYVKHLFLHYIFVWTLSVTARLWNNILRRQGKSELHKDHLNTVYGLFQGGLV